jgi:hypothetical protein
MGRTEPPDRCDGQRLGGRPDVANVHFLDIPSSFRVDVLSTLGSLSAATAEPLGYPRKHDGRTQLNHSPKSVSCGQTCSSRALLTNRGRISSNVGPKDEAHLAGNRGGGTRRDGHRVRVSRHEVLRDCNACRGCQSRGRSDRARLLDGTRREVRARWTGRLATVVLPTWTITYAPVPDPYPVPSKHKPVPVSAP